MHRRTRQTEFTPKARRAIYDRDGGGCIFCRMKYHMDRDETYGYGIFDVMHYVPRSQGGLGIEENGVLGCRYHHMMLDNGADGRRPEMLMILRGYLSGHYPGWSEEGLAYRKWPRRTAGTEAWNAAEGKD